MKKLFLLLLFLLICSGDAFANGDKMMECSFYNNETNPRVLKNKTKFIFDAKDSSLLVSNTDENFYFSKYREFKVLNFNDKYNRIVAVSDISVDSSSLLEPVLIVHVDFSNPRLKYETFGSVTDFRKLIHNSIDVNCRRLD